MTFSRTLALALTLSAALSCPAQPQPKREFRGAWIQCVNGQWLGLDRDQMQRTLTAQLDALSRAGVNAVLFQVRAEGDALYPSLHEPWSRFLSGQQGLAPSPYWDPLAWMVEECHRRGMELHAWINPFRAKTQGTPALTSAYFGKHPERFLAYGQLLLFDPGIPENRDYICHIAADIVRDYDVDGLHIDDYFYPYPEAGLSIPDDASYARYGAGMSRADWRRENVNAFIKALSDSVHSAKPWVRFGVAPFGIYRNKDSWAGGSDTHGLQNYDDLYADVLLWVNEGWVDYCIPQIYWEIGHPAADYVTLLRWWNENASARPLYVGQDVERTVANADTRDPSRHQIYEKMNLQRSMRNVQGSCQWHAAALASNPQNYTAALQALYHRYPALQPLMPWLGKAVPSKVRNLRAAWTAEGCTLSRQAPKAKSEADEAHLLVFPLI